MVGGRRPPAWVWLALAAIAACGTPRRADDRAGAAVFRIPRGDGPPAIWPEVARGASTVFGFPADEGAAPGLRRWAAQRPGVSVHVVVRDRRRAAGAAAQTLIDADDALARRIGVTTRPAYALYARGVRVGVYDTLDELSANAPKAGGPKPDASKTDVPGTDALPAGAAPWADVADEGEELGTRYSVVVSVRRGTPEERVRADLARARAVCRSLERRMSEWRIDSEISKINRAAGERTVPLSAEMRLLLEGAQQVARATDGAFDVTFAPWMTMWSEAERAGRQPDAATRDRYAKRVGYAQLRIDANGVRFLAPGMKLGIAGFAKGWIIDRVHASLREAGYERVIVNIGGDLRVSGRAADGKPRRIRIVDPYRPTRTVGALAVEDDALATSGNYIRFRTIGGARIGHVVDPRTGSPPPFDGSVTVRTRDAAMADALATALFVMGPERGLAWARKTDGVDALFVTRAGVLRSWGD